VFCDPVRRVVVLADGSSVGGGNSLTDGLTWEPLNDNRADAFGELTEGLEPFPAVTMPGVNQLTAGFVLTGATAASTSSSP
jgi:hypothetical protein